MFGRRLHLVEIDDIDEAHLQIRQSLAQDRDGGERLERRDIAARGHDDVRFDALVIAGATPDADAFLAMNDRLVDRRELHVLLLVGDDHVDAVG